MIHITSPDKFKSVPWKNGLGVTQELAMSPDGTLTDFDWRLSIATVNENGLFSNFSGYTRDLVLISGNGLSLCHDSKRVDNLKRRLDVAHFDGGSRTVSTLFDGAINDFNVMAKTSCMNSDVMTFEQIEAMSFRVEALAFVYAVSNDISVFSQHTEQNINLPAGHLMQITMNADNTAQNGQFRLSGRNIILVKFKRLSE